ncbi:MAG: winged helix-turn-helix domain-containing protein [Acidobacteria bacterium]|jgi:serine/threonine-protein kinase|nr:winged helix-turn-helix domain-containing protein [Acidobacteriota bacterium]
MDEPQTRIYEFGEFRLDAVKRLLLKGGEISLLMPKAFDTLLYLVQNGGRVIDKDELMREVWTDTIVEENNLSQNISILRRVLGEKKSEHRFIVTVPGKGFKFVAEVRAVSESASDAPLKTIAVLPFKPLIAENRNEALELGMADTLIAKLGGEEIVVRPFSAVRHYASVGQEDCLLAARQLGVQAVLEGTIQTAGDRIRVSARLVCGDAGKQLWAGQFNEKFDDIFAVQDLISERVAAALHIRLTGENKTRSMENVEAYQFYVKGRVHTEMLLLPELRKAIGYFERAIALDANYALAYVGLAQSYLRLSLVNNIPADEAMPQAKAAALRATEIAPLNADTFSTLAWIVFWYDRDWRAAEKYCLRGIKLNPNNPFVRVVHAHLLSNTGRHTEALAEIRRARELDPTSIFNQAIEGQILLFAGKTDEALDTLKILTEAIPNFWLGYLFISRVYNEKQMYDEAIAALAKAGELFPANKESTALRGYSLAKAGKLTEAQAVLDELRQSSNYVAPYNLAMIHNGLGETETALDYLEKAYSEKNVLMVFLKVEPKWNNLRNEPRFIDLMKRMNLQ